MVLTATIIQYQKNGGVAAQFELETALTGFVNGAHEAGEGLPSFEEITTMEDFGAWLYGGFIPSAETWGDGYVRFQTYNVVIGGMRIETLRVEPTKCPWKSNNWRQW